MLECDFCDQDHSRGSPDCPAQRVGQVVRRKYRLDRLIGTGGMAAVYDAIHLQVGNRVALKIPHRKHRRNAGLMERFRREVQAVIHLTHPAIVRAIDFDEDTDGSPFMVMELLAGQSVDEALRVGPMSPSDAVRVTMQALEALEVAHAASVVHRDLKPSNLYLADVPDGSTATKVLDFGVAKVASQARLTSPGTTIGTPCYSSPEQLRSADRADHRSDLYSLGATLFDMLTGRVHVEGTGQAAIVAVLEGRVLRSPRTLRHDIPVALDDVVVRALAHEPDERFQSAREMRAALLVVARELSTSKPDARPPALAIALRPMPPTRPGPAPIMPVSARPVAPTAPPLAGAIPAPPLGLTELRCADRAWIEEQRTAARGGSLLALERFGRLAVARLLAPPWDSEAADDYDAVWRGRVRADDRNHSIMAGVSSVERLFVDCHLPDQDERAAIAQFVHFSVTAWTLLLSELDSLCLPGRGVPSPSESWPTHSRGLCCLTASGEMKSDRELRRLLDGGIFRTPEEQRTRLGANVSAFSRWVAEACAERYSGPLDVGHLLLISYHLLEEHARWKHLPR